MIKKIAITAFVFFIITVSCVSADDLDVGKLKDAIGKNIYDIAASFSAEVETDEEDPSFQYIWIEDKQMYDTTGRIIYKADNDIVFAVDWDSQEKTNKLLEGVVTVFGDGKELPENFRHVLKKDGIVAYYEELFDSIYLWIGYEEIFNEEFEDVIVTNSNIDLSNQIFYGAGEGEDLEETASWTVITLDKLYNLIGTKISNVKKEFSAQEIDDYEEEDISNYRSSNVKIEDTVGDIGWKEEDGIIVWAEWSSNGIIKNYDKIISEFLAMEPFYSNARVCAWDNGRIGILYDWRDDKSYLWIGESELLPLDE